MPVTSLCPSSKEISDIRRAQPAVDHHDHRAHARAGRTSRICCASRRKRRRRELFGILKRADEKFVTERAYDNPRFVEDLVRGVASRLDADARFDAFAVEAENFESIHNHSAYARIGRGL